MFGLKTWEIVGGILFIFAIVAVIFGVGYASGSNHVQKKFDSYKADQAQAVEADRSGKQDKSDSIDEDAAKQIQDLMIKNAQLQRDLDAETVKPDYDCIVPESGRMLLNNSIRSN